LDNLRREVIKINDSAVALVDVSQVKAAAPVSGVKSEIRKKKKISAV
jgi:hypothetical protein